VWGILAQFWVDTWYDAGQLERFTDQIVRCGFSMRELDWIAYREVCGAFATFTLVVFLSVGMALPVSLTPPARSTRSLPSMPM